MNKSKAAGFEAACTKALGQELEEKGHCGWGLMNEREKVHEMRSDMLKILNFHLRMRKTCVTVLWNEQDSFTESLSPANHSMS